MASFGRVILLVIGIPLIVGAAEYRSVSLDRNRQLHIVLESGKEILAPKVRGQLSFGDPVISPDRQTVGWLVMVPDPAVTYYKGAEFAGSLVIYRGGRVLHVFTSEQIFWGWQFRDEGKRVAYSVGPSHGGAVECVLRDVDTGRVVERWQVREGVEAPVWARELHQ